MAKNMYIGGSINKIDYSALSYEEQIKLGELTIAFISVAPSSYNDSITPVWNDSLGKFVFPDGVTTTLASSGEDWFAHVSSSAGYVDFVSFAIPTENPNAYYSYEVDEAGAETRGKFTHSFAEDVARKVKSIYLGVDGVARRIKKVYIGDENRLARLCYEFNPSYLTFSSPNSFTLKVNDTTKHWDGTLEYSTDTSVWSTWDGTTTLSSTTNGSNNVLYLRGTGNTVITGNSQDYKWVLTGSNIACIGNIENLLDYATVESGAHPTMTSHCYQYMFRGCTALTQAPALPAMTLTDSCYKIMFSSCTSLTQAPALPATTLANNCYQSMFFSCTSLTQAPALPATTLANSCYTLMFSSCTSLTQVPALPATTLASNCYKQMFNDCTSLTQAPALPATTLANNCYDAMFSGCTALTQAPDLPATTLANNCYQSMFNQCSGLTQAPALPAMTLASGCYQSMFFSCTSLTQVPALPATTLANNCYIGMFNGCTKIKLSDTQTGEYTVAYRIPTTGTGTNANGVLYNMFGGTKGTYKGTPKIDTTYYLSNTNTVVYPPTPYLTFSSPSSFTLKVNDTTKHWDGTLEYSTDTSTWSTWDGTTTLSSATSGSDNVLYMRGTGNTVITGSSSDYRWVLTGSDIACIGNIENLLDYVTVESGNHPTMASNCYNQMFYKCTSLTRAPALPATTLADYCYAGMFSGCSRLTQTPALPATTLAMSCYQNMFRGCTALTQAPALPATTLASNCYNQMFNGCSSLTQAPALPATTLADRCYYSMFNGCTSLTQAPALPATTLVSSCYMLMFQNCIRLTQAPALPATTLADYCYQYMFNQCSSLTQAPALPATTLAANCYYSMFNGCTSLTQAPALPATTLVISCYQNMFKGCTSIKLSNTQTGEYTQAYRIPTTGTGTTETNALTDMFASTGGTFTGTPDINTTYYLSNTNTVV